MRYDAQRVFPADAQKATADQLAKIAVVPPELPGLIDKYREVGNEFNNLAHYFNAGGALDVDSVNRLTRALEQLESLSEEVRAMTRNFREKWHTYPRKNP